MNHRFAWLFVVATLALGCNSIKEKIAEKAAEKVAEKAFGDGVEKVDISKGQVVLKGKDGESVILGGDDIKLPAEWPSEVPVYAGAKIRAVVASKNGHMVTLDTPAAGGDVIGFYDQRLSSFNKEVSMDMDGMRSRSYTNGTGLTVSVNVLGKSSDEKRVLQLTATRKAKP